MGRETSTERHRHSHKHSKHSKHKHKHKHGRHHHSSKHKKKRSRSDRERKRDDTPEVQVNERDLQAALEKLDEAIIEQCVQSDNSTSSNTPSPSPLSHESQLQEPNNSLKSLSESTSEAKIAKDKVSTQPLNQNESVESTNETQSQTTSVNIEIENRESPSNVKEDLKAQFDEDKMRKEKSAVNEKNKERKDQIAKVENDAKRNTSSSESDCNDLQVGKDLLETRNKKSIEINIAGTNLPNRESPLHTASGDKKEAGSDLERASSASENIAEESSRIGSDNEASGDEKRRKRKKHSSHKKKKRKHHKKHSKRSRHSSFDSSYSSSRSLSISHSRSRRSNSYSRRKRYSRSPSHSRRSHSRSRSRSPYHSRSKRRHSRSPYRSDRQSYRTRGWRPRNRYHSTRSRFHSSSRYSRRGSGGYSRHSRSRSKSWSRSTSLSPHHHRRRRRRSYSSRSLSKSRSPDHRSKKDRSKSNDDANDGNTSNVVIGDAELKSVVKEMTTKIKQAHINQFTALCKDLQTKQEREDGGEQVFESEAQNPVRAPFELSTTRAYQSGLVLHNNVWKTPNQIITENNVLQAERPLTEKFPVSCGIEHQQKENTHGQTETAQDLNVFAAGSKPLPMSELIVMRLEATQRLQQNPQDMEAQQMLNYVEQQTSAWIGSNTQPGKFTGKKQLNPLKPEDHKTGIQAWAKKDMFKGLAPVLSGFGMKMMKKMGWNEGQPLGRMGKGVTEPIPMSVKVDRAGLSSSLDKSQPLVPVSAIKASSTTAKSAHLVEGKHPVSALQEICAKKHWDPPHYELVTNTGLSHQMSFRYKVALPIGCFQPALASANKKQAKVQAALACLQALGFVENAL